MAYKFENISIMIIEDNQPMLDLTKSMLITFGIGRVIVAKDGEEGFKKFNAEQPDIVIADWMVKPTDGIRFTRRVRSHPDSRDRFVPIILMTGFSEKHRVIKARDAGVTEFLVKPFTARDMYRRISQVIERPRQFVNTTNFFGPDRRRKKITGSYKGLLRRAEDREKYPELWERQQEEMENAHKTLADIRAKAGLYKGDAIDPDVIRSLDEAPSSLPPGIHPAMGLDPLDIDMVDVSAGTGDLV